MTDESFDVRAAFARGVERMGDALGPEVEQAVRRERDKAAQAGDPERVELPIALTWGWLLQRPGLPPRERVLAMIAVDIARGTWRALDEHLQLAASVDVSEAELRELFVHLGPYAGYPALNDAWEVLGRHLVRTRSAPAPASGPAGSASAGYGRAPTGWLGARAELLAIGAVVPDAARTAAELAALAGITDWAVTRADGDRAELVVDGRPVDYELVRAVASTSSGVRIELVEPRRGATPDHLALLATGAGIRSLTVAELDPDWPVAAGRPLGPSAPTATTWRTAAGPALHTLDTTGTLGVRVAIVSGRLADFDAALGVDETWRLPTPPDGPLVPLGSFGHVGIVVPDLAAATRAHAEAFGRTRWPVLRFSTDDDTLTRARYDGAAGREAYLSSVAKVGGFAVELIQPTGGPSRYREGFLKPRGAGAHHLFFGPLGDPDDWDGVVTALGEHDYRLVTDAYGWDEALQYAYVDALDRVGFDLELVRMLRPVEVRPGEHAVLTFDHSPIPGTARSLAG